MAGRRGLFGSGRLVPVPSGAGQQPGRLLHRPAAGRLARRAGRLARIHPALRPAADRLRGPGPEPERPAGPRPGSRPQAGGRRRGRASRVGHGAATLSRSPPGLYRARDTRPAGGPENGVCATDRDRPRRGARSSALLCRGATLPGTNRRQLHADAFRVSRRAGGIALLLFCVLLAGLPTLAPSTASRALSVFDGFYRSGALVFGGGHVVLPLLQQQTVATGWVSPNAFLAGYGAAQAVPGPLFTFAAFLGWIMPAAPNHWAGALLATLGIFLPGLLLVLAALPYWQAWRARPAMAAVFAGVKRGGRRAAGKLALLARVDQRGERLDRLRRRGDRIFPAGSLENTPARGRPARCAGRRCRSRAAVRGAGNRRAPPRIAQPSGVAHVVVGQLASHRLRLVACRDCSVRLPPATHRFVALPARQDRRHACIGERNPSPVRDTAGQGG